MKLHLMRGDCLEKMEEIEACSVDMVLADPPYGTTACKWDTVIDLPAMWAHLKRIVKPSGAIVMTASQPFTSALVMSNPKMFKHEWIWIKNRGSNFANTVREPMKEHESVLVFSLGKWTYNKQMQERNGSGKKLVGKKVGTGKKQREGLGKFKGFDGTESLSELRVPSSCQKFNIPSGKDKFHPTQKPVTLMEYLIRTYTNEGETVLDFTMGSGTTGVACQNTGRNFIGIELDPEYYAIADRRIQGAGKCQKSTTP